MVVSVDVGGYEIGDQIQDAQREEKREIREPNVVRSQKIRKADSDELEDAADRRPEGLPTAHQQVSLMLVPQMRNGGGWRRN